jgi:predicted RecB family nuclease
MKLTVESIASLVHCRYKAYLELAGNPGELTDYEQLNQELLDAYRCKAAARLSHEAAQPLSSSLADFVKSRRHLAFDITECDDRHSITLDALERIRPTDSGRKSEYVPIIFSPNSKLSKIDTLPAAVLATALATWHSLSVGHFKVIHGERFAVARLSLLNSDGRPTRLYKEATALLNEFERMAATQGEPQMYLNKHCGVCKYRHRCRTKAVERDDLSLLRGLQVKEIAAWNERGIFTVTQLAHTFRGKIVGRGLKQPTRHSQQLQALAIRDQKTFVRACPQLPTTKTKVFFDVEGVPDQDFYYLIGAVVVKDEHVTSQQFWADSPDGEHAGWEGFVRMLSDLGAFVAIHFGRYEREFVRKMIHRYGGDVSLVPLFDAHAAIRTNVFFPVYGNGLKDIAEFVGASWAGPICSGVDSIVWRHRWEASREPNLKDDLLRYNHEDCLALMAVFERLETITAIPSENSAPIEDGNANIRKWQAHFGQAAFALPVMKQFTQCAYFNYQRDKVFFRTDKAVRRSSRRRHRSAAAPLRANQVVVGSAPERCPKCDGTRMTTYSICRASKLVKDLKFFRGGVKRWVVKYETDRYQCRSCRHTCYSPQYPTGSSLFGRNVASWAVYQHVAAQQSFKAIAQSVNDVFGFGFSDNISIRAQRQLADVYRGTEDILLSRLRSGRAICIDEAKIGLQGRRSGYVWVFSGPEIVIYRFTPSRESAILSDVLRDYSGVVVSDFYGAYDSLACPQQKCLIHLIRDINDDLLKHPFNEELKKVASRFTALMVPIIESIDRYGLKTRHLGKFVKLAGRHRHWLARERFSSTVAQHYQTRVGKYGERLFTFLSYDGVPWNNNLAENAVKLIASRRKMLNGLMSEAGIKDYLTFLSIFQTLRRKGGSLLRFLLSGKADVFEFLKEK